MLADNECLVEPHLEVQSTLWGAAFVFGRLSMAFCQWMLAYMNARFCFVLVVNCISAEYCLCCSFVCTCSQAL